MIFDGKAIQVKMDENDFCHFIFNMKEGSANVIGKSMLDELPQALAAVKKETKIKGLLFESEKDHFIFGADITEFLQHFKKEHNELVTWLSDINEVMNGFEDLPFPT